MSTMERTLTETELNLRHVPRCADCDIPAVRGCWCNQGKIPHEFARCVWRVPGERNPDCPSLAGHGGENLTQLMRQEYDHASK